MVLKLDNANTLNYMTFKNIFSVVISPFYLIETIYFKH